MLGSNPGHLDRKWALFPFLHVLLSIIILLFNTLFLQTASFQSLMLRPTMSSKEKWQQTQPGRTHALSKKNINICQHVALHTFHQNVSKLIRNLCTREISAKKRFLSSKILKYKFWKRWSVAWGKIFNMQNENSFWWRAKEFLDWWFFFRRNPFFSKKKLSWQGLKSGLATFEYNSTNKLVHFWGKR